MTEEMLTAILKDAKNFYCDHGKESVFELVAEIRRLKRGPSVDEYEAAANKYWRDEDPSGSVTDAFVAGVRWRDAWNGQGDK